MSAGSARRLSLLAAAAVSAGCGPGSAMPRRADVVPWANRPIPAYVAPLPRPRPYPTVAPACRAGQLEVRQGHGGVGLGNLLERLVFTNAGSTACLLRGYPTISGVTRDGVRRAVPARRGGTYFGRLVPADIPPGGHAFLEFGTSNAGCGNDVNAPATRFRRLRVRLPGGGEVQAPPRVMLVEVCAIDMTTFGLRERYTPATGTLGALHAELRLPARARAGRILRFVVTLVNPGRAAIALDPCPGYTEAVYDAGVVLERSFRLNCDAAHEVRAHGRLRFAMELPLPRRAPARFAKVSWSLNTPYGPAAGGAVRVGG